MVTAHSRAAATSDERQAAPTMRYQAWAQATSTQISSMPLRSVRSCQVSASTQAA